MPIASNLIEQKSLHGGVRVGHLKRNRLDTRGIVHFQHTADQQGHMITFKKQEVEISLLVDGEDTADK